MAQLSQSLFESIPGFSSFHLETPIPEYPDAVYCQVNFRFSTQIDGTYEHGISKETLRKLLDITDQFPDLKTVVTTLYGELVLVLVR